MPGPGQIYHAMRYMTSSGMNRFPFVSLLLVDAPDGTCAPSGLRDITESSYNPNGFTTSGCGLSDAGVAVDRDAKGCQSSFRPPNSPARHKSLTLVKRRPVLEKYNIACERGVIPHGCGFVPRGRCKCPVCRSPSSGRWAWRGRLQVRRWIHHCSRSDSPAKAGGRSSPHCRAYSGPASGVVSKRCAARPTGDMTL